MRNFVHFFPIFTGMPISHNAWKARIWLDTWT
jgi:dolichyl-phosphate-mannose--protein O-mannosyl transferase